MDIKGFKSRDGSKHQYDYNALANKPDAVSGKDGGYYTPAVTQLDEKTVQFDFTPSKEGMPAVESVTVELPVGEDSGQNVNQVEPAESDIPRVFISGVKPTTKDDALAEMQYISKTDRFHAYLEIKCQGSSSMNYPKKNYTVKLYSDEARETKLKKDFKDWNHPGNKFVLKANYIDHSHARNIVSARLWGEIVKSRPDYESLPVEMRNAPNNGAVDGFPVKVYYNGTYEGIYTWNIGKDDWMWGMDEDNPNHILLCAETNTDGVFRDTPCNFRALWSGWDETDWSVEVGTNSASLKTSLNNLIQFVMDNDGEAFRNGIGNYLDIQSAIDYYIFMYDICGLDCLARNMLLATYDGTKWICGAYDLDSTYGLRPNGQSFVSTSFKCPEDYQERFSLLWERIEANFISELKARQAELRKTVLSYSNMVNHFERFMDTIGCELYAEDLTIYTGIPNGSANNIKQIRNYIRDRHVYVDSEFAAMTPAIHATGITLSASTLTFTSTEPQTLTATVEPTDTTESMVWYSSDNTIATIEDGVVTPVANGNCTITAKCGSVSATCAVVISGIVEQIAVKTNLTNCAIDNNATVVGKGDSYTATITPFANAEMQTVTVTMGGVDVTDTVYADGVINIPAVTGDIVITAVAVRHSGIATVTVNTEELEWKQVQTANVPTGYVMFEAAIDQNSCPPFTDLGRIVEVSSPVFEISTNVNANTKSNAFGVFWKATTSDELLQIRIDESLLQAVSADGLVSYLKTNNISVTFNYVKEDFVIAVTDFESGIYDGSGNKITHASEKRTVELINIPDGATMLYVFEGENAQSSACVWFWGNDGAFNEKVYSSSGSEEGLHIPVGSAKAGPRVKNATTTMYWYAE